MDVTTATRFHLGEIAVSTIVRLGIIPLVGIPLRVIVVYELVLLLSTQFHHSNIALPSGIDRILRLVIVSPNMHRVHHSIKRVETDSNYSSVLSIWDRLFRSHRERPDYREISLAGLALARAVIPQAISPWRLSKPGEQSHTVSVNL